MSGEAVERELEWVRKRAGAPRAMVLGCSTISHDKLGYCARCSRTVRDGGPNGTALEVMGWRLLALREAECAVPPPAQNEGAPA